MSVTFFSVFYDSIKSHKLCVSLSSLIYSFFLRNSKYFLAVCPKCLVKSDVNPLEKKTANR